MASITNLDFGHELGCSFARFAHLDIRRAAPMAVVQILEIGARKRSGA
jgi:hypothetical protein